MNADGSNQVNLTNAPGEDVDPVWSPDGSRILFTSSRDGNPEVYVMQADGSNPTNLSRSPAIDRNPSWYPK
jgi:Tol biopolymer transport system component